MATTIKGFASDWSVPAGAKEKLDAIYMAADGTAPASSATSSWLLSRISAAGAGGTVDLNGRDITLTQTLSLNSAVTLRNGTLRRADSRVALVNAPGVKFEKMTFVRTGTDSADGGAAVYVQKEEFQSVDCHYSSTVNSALVLQHGTCNRARIVGGTAASYARRQNAAGIYVSAGNVGNYGIVIDGVTVTGGPDRGPDGIVAYDTNGCVVRNCTVRTLRKLPDVTIPQTWTNTSGNIWESAIVRDDGPTRVVLVNGTEWTEDIATPSAPSAANTWGISGGRVYLNTATNPNTMTVISRIVSGYGITLYCTSGAWRTLSNNRVDGNTIEDTDGFGLYLQLGDIVAVNNTTDGNVMLNTCLAGEQSNKLPFSGFGVIGGRYSTFSRDVIDTVGNTQSRVPGFKHNNAFDASGNFSTGTVVGMIVRNATAAGILVNGGIYHFTGCHVAQNAQAGFLFLPDKNSTVLKAYLTSCEAVENGTHGVDANSAPTPGANLHVTVHGGYFRKNSRGMNLATVASTLVGGGVVFDGNTQQAINVSTGNGLVHLDGVTFVNTTNIAVDNSVARITTGRLLWGTNTGTAATRIIGTGASRVVDSFETPISVSPNGTRYKLTVSDTGTVTAVAI